MKRKMKSKSRSRPDNSCIGSKGAQGLTVGPYRSTYSRIIQFHRDQASDSGDVVTPFMQDGTYPTRNFATLGPIQLTAAVNGPLFPFETHKQTTKQKIKDQK